MDFLTHPGGNGQPFKILSLDDGGVHGLSSLLILERIMRDIQDAQCLPIIPKPCEVFDLIGGTGTGGNASKHEGEMLVLSIGAGLGDAFETGNSKDSIKNALEKVAVNSRNVADELEKEHPKENQRYYRFDSNNGLRAITLSDWIESSKVSADTKNYLDERQDAIKGFTQVLMNGTTPALNQSKKSDGSIPVHYIPFHQSPCFVGRRDVLFKLNNRLFAQTGFQKIALVGLGGMGKTQVALKLAYVVKERRPDYSVFWLTAANTDGFRNSCKELTETLKLESAASQDPRILVKNYLEANERGKWLLILDDIDDASFFDPATKENKMAMFLPQSEKGRIIFTTRSKKVAWLTVECDSLELEEMPSEELTTILMRGAEGLDGQPQIHHKAPINDLLKELCRLPLAVSQAADYMVANHISIAKYLELLKETEESKAELLKHVHEDDTHFHEYQGAVAATWLITLQKIQKLSPAAVDLIQFIAHIDSSAIPQTILPGFEGKKEMADAIRILVAYGFLCEQQSPGLFSMHSLVHFIAKLWCKRLGSNKKQKLAVLDHMTSIFPDSDWGNRFLWRQYLPHALHVVAIEKGSERGIPKLAFKVSQCLQRDGDIQQSVRMLEYVVKMEEEALAADHPFRLTCQNALARAYLAHGQSQKAISMLEHIVKIMERVLASDHPDHLASQYQVVREDLDNGQADRTIPTLEHVDQIGEEVLVAGDTSCLASRNALAKAYLVDGQVDKAVSVLENALTIREKVLKTNHPDRLASQHRILRGYYARSQSQIPNGVLQSTVELDGMSSKRSCEERVKP
ncbi:Nephrocystin-3 [Ceratocystis lukuohia]|uniref:Nephrocystin-3 n=1 Tax=Ceratocystis lukuohia TaxID=2019550 RepID=A0ABR4MHB7_9PEZI